MVFTENKEAKKTFATLTNVGVEEKYECSFLACKNPVCSCGTLTIDFIATNNEDVSDNHSSREIEFDIIDRKLGYKDKSKVSKDDLAFADLVLSQLNEDDFQLMHKRHFAYKNKISESANISEIEGFFEYDEVEKNGLMSAYNDVLPYGNQIEIKIDNEQVIVLDQYCLLPKCPCSDVTLNLMALDIAGNKGDELCTVDLNYKKKQWKSIERTSFDLSIKDLKSTIEEQVPDLYSILRQRHLKLKGIYAHSKKKHFTSKTPMQLPKVGRNEPCPCGSGKKYKKCCIGNSTDSGDSGGKYRFK